MWNQILSMAYRWCRHLHCYGWLLWSNMHSLHTQEIVVSNAT